MVATGIQTRWYDQEDHVILAEVGSTWTIEDTDAHSKRLTEMVSHQQKRCKLIIVLPRDMVLPPSGFFSVARKAIKLHQALQINPVICVCRVADTITLLKSTLETITVETSPYHFVPTIDHANRLMVSYQ